MVAVKKTDYLRTYRACVKHDDLSVYSIVIDETDLLISSKRVLAREAYASALSHRQALCSFIAAHPSFQKTFRPYPPDPDAPPVVRSMIRASAAADVGPMAAVAGAIAQAVGEDLLPLSETVLIENGGDLYVRTCKRRLVGTFAGASAFSGKVFFEVPAGASLGICTSSGTVGYSFSYGKADAVTAIATSAALADAAATAVCNRIRSASDIEGALAYAKGISGLAGVVAVIGEDMGMWGRVSIAKESSDERLVLRLT